MAEPRRRTPRSYFGLSATPQPGLQEPALSPGMKQRFTDNGLESFLPYANPWETVARAQDYRAQENQFKVQDAEERFIQRLQQDPASATTGLQKFLAEDPRLIASPMFRAYAVTQDRLGREQRPKMDPLALAAAEAGKDNFDKFNKDIASGVPQLDAFASLQSRIAEAKRKSPEDERLTLSGTPKEEFDTLMSEYNRTQDFEPTDEDKMKFLPPGRSEYTEQEWSDAYNKAKASAQHDAVRKIERFQQTYGDFYKLPGTAVRARGEQDVPQQKASPWPTDSPTTTGAQAGVVPNAVIDQEQTTNGSTVEDQTIVETPASSEEVLSISERKQPAARSQADINRDQAQTQEFFNTAWTSAKGELQTALEKRKGLEKIADDPELLRAAFRSIQKGEAVLPQDIGLPKPEGGLRPENPADLIAKALGKDPDSIATFSVKEGGKKMELMDTTGKKTWRQVIQSWADEQLQGTSGKSTPASQPAFVTVQSQADYDAIKPGEPYMWNGKPKIKGQK
jgi:hypothetical protein